MRQMDETEAVPNVEERPPLFDGRYELGELAGAGGMAEVLRARDTRLGRDVAVKILSGPSTRDASLRRRIEREARALAAVGHPNIVTVYDYGEAEGPSGEVQAYVVMELADGVDLQRHLDAHGPLDVDEATDILRAVLAAVERAHVAGIVHGDLKPANVILSSDGPKVGDFGVARILAEETGMTTVAATPTFAAPEVLRGERATQRSDVYSAACLAFQMLTGRPPYEGANAWEIATKHIEDPVPVVHDLRADVPAALAGALSRAMAKDPSARHESARAFADALADAPATMRVVARAAAPRPDATEALSDRPDLVGVALLGPLAGVGEWIRERGAAAGRRVRRSPRILLIPLVAVLAVLAAMLLIDPGPELAEVPDVRGMESSSASSQLRLDGFRADVSYRPVTQGEPDIVLETIPATGEMVEPGTKVHVIASALASTPEPVATAENGNGNGRGRGKKDDD